MIANIPTRSRTARAPGENTDPADLERKAAHLEERAAQLRAEREQQERDLRRAIVERGELVDRLAAVETLQRECADTSALAANVVEEMLTARFVGDRFAAERARTGFEQLANLAAVAPHLSGIIDGKRAEIAGVEAKVRELAATLGKTLSEVVEGVIRSSDPRECPGEARTWTLAQSGRFDGLT